MIQMTEVVEESLKADARFRHLTVMPEEISFTIGGKKCHAIKGQASVLTDKSGEAVAVFGVWWEDK